MFTHSCKRLSSTSLSVIISFIFFTGAAFSQVTITMSDFEKIFTPGDIHYFVNGDQTSINIGQTGGPNIYDFSSINIQNLEVSNNYLVSTIPDLAIRFEGSAITMGVTPTTIEKNPVFIFRNDTAYTIGQASLTPAKEFVHYEPYQVIGVFPTVYPWTLSQPMQRFDTTFTSGGQVDNVNISSSTEITTVDGYGTLKIGGGEYQCLRIKKDHSGYGDKEFVFMTREGVFVVVGLMPATEPDTGLVSSGYTVLIAPGTVGVEDNESVPLKFSLSQNYPNPFNPTTIIKYSVARTALVNIKLYDLLGREIKTLINENKIAGNYSITFNASQLPSGVYFYRITAGNYSEVRKMVLLK